jgi:hypothetical protein
MGIRQDDLKNKAYRYNQRIDESQYTASYIKKKTAFLCHSHKDETLVKGLIVIFREANIHLYVDWMDQSMPEKPNKVTAENIKSRIKNSDLFIFLATANSKASRWCPWEIGFADGVNKNVYIVPTSDGYNTYGNEYLELYSKIDSGTFHISGKPGYFITKIDEDTGYGISNRTLI